MKNLVIFTLFNLLFFSCQNATNESEDYVYPMRVGNSWDYSRTYEIIVISGDPSVADSLPSFDPSYVNVRVDRQEILNDTLNSYVIEMRLNESTSFAEDYYYHDSNGLYMIAYRNPEAAPSAFPKQEKELHIEFNGRVYHSFEQIGQIYLAESIPFYKVASDTLVFEEGDVISLKYPLQIGSFWFFREKYPWKMAKTVEKRTEISTPAGTFDCFQIKWLYDIDDNNIWDDDIYIIDYIAAVGLIKREIHLTGYFISEVDGSELATLDHRETITLSHFSQE